MFYGAIHGLGHPVSLLLSLTSPFRGVRVALDRRVVEANSPLCSVT